MIKNNTIKILHVFTACFTLITANNLFSSKKIKQEVQLTGLPTEVIEHIISYAEPKTQIDLLRTAKTLRALTKNQLVDRLVQENIKKGNYAVPHFMKTVQKISEGEMRIPEFVLLNLVIRQYTEETETGVIYKDTSFYADYKKIFLKNIDYFLNSKPFFDMIFDTYDINKDTRLLLEKYFNITIILAKLIEEKPPVFQPTVFVKDIEKQFTFLNVNSFTQANELLPVYVKPITKILVKQYFDLRVKYSTILTNINNYFIPIVDPRDMTLLSIACATYDIELIKICLEKKVSWHSDSFTGNNPLHWIMFPDSNKTTTIARRLERIKTMLDQLKKDGLQNINKQNNQGRTPLLLYMSEMTSLFITIRNFYENNEEERNMIPQDIRFFTQRVRLILESLLKSGANPNIADNNGNTPLLLCGKHLKEEVKFFSLYPPLPPGPLPNFYPLIIDILLRFGANPNIEKNGKTLLSKALSLIIDDNVSSNHIGLYICSLLLQNGANPNIVLFNNNLTSPLVTIFSSFLHKTISDSSQGAIKWLVPLLILHNANINQPTRDPFTSQLTTSLDIAQELVNKQVKGSQELYDLLRKGN